MSEIPGETPQRDYFKVKIDWWEALTKYRLSGEEIKCLMFILRKTYGWKKKSDKIALSQFVKATDMVKPSVCRALKKLVIKNIIIINKKANDKHSTYCFNKNFKTWNPLTKKLTLTKKLMSINKKANESLTKKRHTIDNSTIDNITKDTKSYVRTKKMFERDSIPFLLSETLFNQIVINIPTFKDNQNGRREKTIQSWATDIEKMIRIDKRIPCHIWNMILWVAADDFWFKNILSGSKLRKQYDRLSAAITADVRKNRSKHDKLIEAGNKWLNKNE